MAGVAIIMAMDTRGNINNPMAMGIGNLMGTRKVISNPMPTCNLSTFRRLCTMYHSNRPASV